MNNGRLCIFGEVLFDHFPDGKRVLGGAPFNVAWHLQAFGAKPHFISRVGNDPEGEHIRVAMQDWGMDTSGLQTDDRLPTGRVDVAFIDGEPRYDIVQPCAYDAIEPPAEIEACRLLYHGSLAARHTGSRDALRRLRAGQPRTVFIDVNLRPPWWDREETLDMLRGAHWVKLNTDELARLHPPALDSDTAAREFLAEHGLRGLLLTHGSRGAEVLTDSGERLRIQPDSRVPVIDTVGAGDAFASVMILGLASGWALDSTLSRAQGFASQIVGQRGATVREPAFYQPFTREWGLET